MDVTLALLLSLAFGVHNAISFPSKEDLVDEVDSIKEANEEWAMSIVKDAQDNIAHLSKSFDESFICMTQKALNYFTQIQPLLQSFLDRERFLLKDLRGLIVAQSPTDWVEPLATKFLKDINQLSDNIKGDQNSWNNFSKYMRENFFREIKRCISTKGSIHLQ